MKILPILFALGLVPSLLSAEYEPWPEDVLETFAKVPVQHDGRVKPMQTVAHWVLIELSGRSKLAVVSPEEARTYKTEMPPGREGVPRKLSATEWMLDVFFRPQQAREYPVFVVDDSSAVTAIGAEARQKKRNYYSYSDLLPGRAKLAELASRYAQKASREEKLTALEDQIMILGKKVNTFEFLASAFTPAQPSRLVNAGVIDPDMKEILDTVQISGLLERMPAMSMDSVLARLRQNPNALSEDERTVLASLKVLFFLSRSATAITPFPPKDPENKDWVSTGALVSEILESEKDDRGWAMERLQKLETLAAAANTPSTFAGPLEEFRAFVQQEAEARGEAKGIDKEYTLYDKKLIPSSKVLFIMGCIFMLLGWIKPSSTLGKVASTIGLWMGILALGYLIYGMTLRSQIRGWAPITNLYETFLFIAAGSFVFGVLFEYFNPKRNRIAISVALFLPAICLLLAGQFVKLNPSDTLPPLVAVLRSNFWLTTHVITIVLGYAAGLVAAVVSHFWIVGKALGIRTKDRHTMRDISRMTYGIVLFSLIFSLVGTVLGGIWANYSWGRFWGWDPKENGALMIVLWTLFILHARLGGYIKELGLHVLTVILGCIISFSWFGVNALGVGLHSYGFASGIWTALYIYWGIEAFVLLLAVWIKVREWMEKSGGNPQGRRPARA